MQTNHYRGQTSQITFSLMFSCFPAPYRETVSQLAAFPFVAVGASPPWAAAVHQPGGASPPLPHAHAARYLNAGVALRHSNKGEKTKASLQLHIEMADGVLIGSAKRRCEQRRRRGGEAPHEGQQEVDERQRFLMSSASSFPLMRSHRCPFDLFYRHHFHFYDYCERQQGAHVTQVPPCLIIELYSVREEEKHL